MCKYAKCIYAECSYANCSYAVSHYAECRYAECPDAACYYAVNLCFSIYLPMNTSILFLLLSIFLPLSFFLSLSLSFPIPKPNTQSIFKLFARLLLSSKKFATFWFMYINFESSRYFFGFAGHT